jgi:uncharacterized protein YqjF (DUF2071 family)
LAAGQAGDGRRFEHNEPLVHPALLETGHRPWPIPSGSWFMQMDWEQLLFAHWPVPPRALAEFIPPGLELETFEGDAFIGLVPFRMANVRRRYAPSLPGGGVFPELNVRTYVRAGDRPGVWFFSLDATSWLSVRLARVGFGLPYFDARMSIDVQDGWVSYAHERTHRGASPAEFRGRYRPVGAEQRAEPGTLEHFLTERYCLYAARRGRVLRSDVAHQPWPLHRAELELERNTMGDQLQLGPLGDPPLLHFAPRIRTVVWSPRRLL